MTNGKEKQLCSQRAQQASANNGNGLSYCFPGNKFVEKYMYQSGRPAKMPAEHKHVSYGDVYSNQEEISKSLRRANEVFALNTRYSLRARRKDLPKEVLKPEYAVRGITNLMLNREALKDELNKTPYLYHVHKPNAFLSRYYRQERDGPNRVAPAPGLGFLSKPHRCERMNRLQRQVKRVGSVPMCMPPASQRRGDGGGVTHYRLLNGEELREQLQAYPAYRDVLDPYEVVLNNQKMGCLKKKPRVALKKCQQQ